MENWVKEQVDYRINKIATSYSASNKKYHYNKILELFDEYPELNKYYILDDNNYYYDQRIKRRNFEDIKELRTEKNNNNINGRCGYTPKYTWQLSDENFSGLYFIGEIGYNPIINQKFFMVKIGQTENIKKRMAQYRTHNPNFWHENCSLKIDTWQDREYYETLAHKALNNICIKKCPNADEWFIVSEKIYFELCEACSCETSFYEFIKTGE